MRRSLRVRTVASILFGQLRPVQHSARRALLGAVQLVSAVTLFQMSPGGAAEAEGNVRKPPASTSSWPDETNTGAPAEVKLKPSGPLAINVTGTAISGLDIHGGVLINADNVTIEMSRIAANEWAVIKIGPSRTGVVVRDCTIDGMGAAPDGTGNQGIMGQGTFLRNNISNVENGIVITGNNNVIEDNFIHDLNAGGKPHYDGIQIDGGISDVMIRHNTIINAHGAAGAIMIDNEFGPVSNVVIENNLLAGGSYTIYSDAKFNSNPITDVSITNNHIAAGQYGPVLFRGNTPAYAGNSRDGGLLLRALKLNNAWPHE
jgi:Right handed beta helix region